MIASTCLCLNTHWSMMKFGTNYTSSYYLYHNRHNYLIAPNNDIVLQCYMTTPDHHNLNVIPHLLVSIVHHNKILGRASDTVMMLEKSQASAGTHQGLHENGCREVGVAMATSLGGSKTVEDLGPSEISTQHVSSGTGGAQDTSVFIRLGGKVWYHSLYRYIIILQKSFNWK